MFRIHRFCDANQAQADGKVKNELLSAIRGSRDKGNPSQGEGCRLALYTINHLSVHKDGCWEDQVSLCSLESAFPAGALWSEELDQDLLLARNLGNREKEDWHLPGGTMGIAHPESAGPVLDTGALALTLPMVSTCRRQVNSSIKHIVQTAQR